MGGKQSNESKLDLRELIIQEVDLNQENLLQQEEGEFPNQFIKAPDETSFCTKGKTMVFPGITEGALYNIITLSKGSKVRLYEVTAQSVSLLSCSEPSNPAVKEVMNGFAFKAKNLSLVPDKHHCCVYLFGGFRTNRRIEFYFNPKTGALLSEKIADFNQNAYVSKVETLELTAPVNSLLDSFVAITTSLSGRDPPRGLSSMANYSDSFFKMRRGRLRFWADFEQGMSEKAKRELERFNFQRNKLKNNVLSGIPLSKFTIYETAHYSSTNPNLVILIRRQSDMVFFQLVDLKTKKMLKSSCLNLIDIFGEDGINLLLQQDSGGVEDSRTGVVFPQLGMIPSEIEDCVYYPKGDAILLSIQFNQLSVGVRVDNIFRSNLARKYDLKVNKRSTFEERFREPFRWMKKFGDDKIISLYMKALSSSQNKPFAWLDPITFEESELKGIGGHPRREMILHTSEGLSPELFKINDKRILIINEFSAFVYDFDEGRLISEQRLFVPLPQSSYFVRIGSLLVKSYSNSLHLIKIESQEEGTERKVGEMKTLHTNRYFEYSTYDLNGASFNFFELENKNYLYVGLKSFMDNNRMDHHYRQLTPWLVSLEIDRETLEVVRGHKRRMPQLTNNFMLNSCQKVSNFFVFFCSFEEFTKAAPKVNLALSTLDFEIVDYCKKSRLGSYHPIKAASDNRIISIGEKDKIYLHEINISEQKLILLRVVKLKSAVLCDSYSFYTSRFYASLKVRRISKRRGQEQNGNSFSLLKFDFNLDLVHCLRLNGAQDLGALYSHEDPRVAVASFPAGVQGLRVNLIDLESGVLELAHSYRQKPGEIVTENYCEERETGKFFSVEFDSERIRMVCLNR